MDDFTKLRKCKVLLENCGVRLRRCSIFLTKIDQEKENRRENFPFPKIEKKFFKRRLKERFIVSSKYRKKKSLVVKYQLSLPGKLAASLGKALVQGEAFDFPSEEINSEPSLSREIPQVFSAPRNPGDQKEICDFREGTDLVNIVDLNRNQQHQVNINSQLSDEIFRS